MAPLNFKYKVLECDVNDKDSLEKFRARLEQWDDWLNGDDVNSIWSQLHGLAWMDATHRIIKASQRISGKSKFGWASRNPLVAEYCDNAWIASITLGISKLTDKRPDVVSLYRLVEDIHQHSQLVTRQNLVCYDGLSFDPVEAEKRHYRCVVEPNIAAGNRVWTSSFGGPDDSRSSERRQLAFDSIGAAGGSSRDRQETLCPELLPRLKTRLLSARKNVEALRHKFIAHAADKTSRGKTVNDIVTFGKVEQSLRAVVEVAYDLSDHILGLGAGQLLAIAQFNQFEGLDRPWLPHYGMRRLTKVWKGYEQRTKAWRPPGPPTRDK